MNHPSTKLVEGVDYYIEAGRWVFTAAYHLKRRHCCESGCRHCPYGNSPTDHVSTSDDRSLRVEECK
jgi:hypothetical protein